MSALVHTPGGARADSCLGSSHALILVQRALIVFGLGTYFMMRGTEDGTAFGGEYLGFVSLK